MSGSKQTCISKAKNRPDPFNLSLDYTDLNLFEVLSQNWNLLPFLDGGETYYLKSKTPLYKMN